jgi:hypothetical protein
MTLNSAFPKCARILSVLMLMGTGAIGMAPAAQATSYYLDFEGLDPLDVRVGDWDSDNKGDKEDYLISDEWLQTYGVSINAYGKPDDYSKPDWEYNPNVDYAKLESRDLILFNTDPNYYGDAARKNNGHFKGGFDTDLLTGIDSRTGKDYVTDPLGNVLIMQERRRHGYKPDDEAGGGLISFTFQEIVDLTSIDLLDVEDDFDKRGKQIIFNAYGENDTHLRTWRFDEDALGEQVTQVSAGTDKGNNSLYTFNFNQQGVKRFDVLYPGSGAIAALRWEQNQAPPKVPEPATALGLLTLVGAGLRLKRSQPV